VSLNSDFEKQLDSRSRFPNRDGGIVDRAHAPRLALCLDRFLKQVGSPGDFASHERHHAIAEGSTNKPGRTKGQAAQRN
jgi:hypothetical protein